VGKRGPAPKGEYEGKSQVLSTRIRPDTRARLVEASRESGRSLSQEIEHRLRRTFIDDEKISDVFGDRKTFMLMRVAALALQWQSLLSDRDWLNDPWLFDLAIKTINRTFEAIRPSGPANPPVGGISEERAEHGKEFMIAQVPSMLWLDVQEADAALPLNAGTRYERLLGLIKAEIGEVAERSPDKLEE
jgi:hypothetical protein